VLAYFDSYIDSMCIRPIVYDNSRRSYQLDILMKTELQGKLLRAIVKFKL
ncbi:helix-turn-helix domain-containing protein, partial [Streptococcus equi]